MGAVVDSTLRPSLERDCTSFSQSRTFSAARCSASSRLASLAASCPWSSDTWGNAHAHVSIAAPHGAWSSGCSVALDRATACSHMVRRRCVRGMLATCTRQNTSMDHSEWAQWTATPTSTSLAPKMHSAEQASQGGRYRCARRQTGRALGDTSRSVVNFRPWARELSESSRARPSKMLTLQSSHCHVEKPLIHMVQSHASCASLKELQTHLRL